MSLLILSDILFMEKDHMNNMRDPIVSFILLGANGLMAEALFRVQS